MSITVTPFRPLKPPASFLFQSIRVICKKCLSQTLIESSRYLVLYFFYFFFSTAHLLLWPFSTEAESLLPGPGIELKISMGDNKNINFKVPYFYLQDGTRKLKRCFWNNSWLSNCEFNLWSGNYELKHIGNMASNN